MLKRVMTAAIGLPVIIGVIVAGSGLLQLALFIVAVVGMSEMYNTTLNGRGKELKLLAYVFAAIYYVMIGNVGSGFSSIYLSTIQRHFSNFFLVFAAMFIVALLIVLVVGHRRISLADCALVVIGFFHIAFLLSFIYMVRHYIYGRYFVWLIFIAAWGCDTSAYFVGTILGRHKLAPDLSPKKTVEGAVGGVVGAGAIAAVYGFAITRFFVIPEPDIHIILFCTVAGAVGAVFAQFGDLAASAIKRYTGVKDYGGILPGHGGIIDRFDSVLFTAPVVYIVMFVILNFYYRW